MGITKPIVGIDLPKLLAGLEIIAPTRAGTAIASDNLTNGGSIVSEGTGFNPTSSSLTNAALPATKKVVNIFGYFLVDRI
ncbi:MAG: hypothetical protein IM585_01990 [Pseudanabaena sp. M135S2SP2A07QC]|nr:hypothetical protein [Pseudanabaena sp. M090S1SP2A07QC]MCA6507666.1 hypothetical protein [Pseudanabaena sp. M172S2SP2A07QC]MCA6517687.1 hypothetical protein [Pseudanabaena sp. M110S1SP2A07QC]MCA6520631.1 hypothetical protein [Pseudanabaena sp. M051S1SP2A07QC]MCA6526648.1 hypothetical protein [Pseudanabaena sp. M179S2SP2A07QC]MCA6529927.1 hypothetical protein [Pseudanabaena sp. M125S2SP2A07QC]MCA6532715.1 hypothetical protein [Pseudanabaena sp. M176S2SP2A07QC]MCA6537636.1 hypothetical prot